MMVRRVGVVLIAALLITALAHPTSQAQAVPSLDHVELRADNTVLVAWDAISGATRYDIALRPSGGLWRVVEPVRSFGDEPVIRRVLKPGDDWSPVPGTEYEIGVRVGTSPYATAALRSDSTRAAVTQSGSSSSSVTVNWTAVGSAENFDRYELFVAAAGDSIAECKVAEVSNRATQQLTVTSLAPDCGAGPLQTSTAYTAGVRIVQQDSPTVATEIAAATVTTTGGGAVAAELFRTSQVAGTWQVVTAAGTPVAWNSINVRRGELTSFAFSSSDFTSIAAQGFDSVRIVLEWDRFEPVYGVFESASFEALDRAIDFADAAGINVILDPVHLAEAPSWNVPTWAWEHSNDGTLADDAVFDAVRENARPYLRYIAQRYRDRTNVIALDLINEPREPAGFDLDARNRELIELYHDFVVTVRAIEPTMPLVLEPFYGSAVIAGADLASIAEPTVADPAPSSSDFDNLIWSVHDYYAGYEGGAADDGYTPSGYPLRGTAPDGTLYRTETWMETGCYPTGPAVDQCTNQASRELLLKPSMTNYVTRHYDAAQSAAMATYIGEFGIPHEGLGNPGWGGGEQFLTDKVSVYDSLGIGRAVWSWRSNTDPTFGLYDRATNEWHPWTPYATGVASAGPQDLLIGDVNCDGQTTIVDALVIAQYAAGIRTPAPSCPLSNPAGQLFVPPGDVNQDNMINIVDSLFIAQCTAGLVDGYC